VNDDPLLTTDEVVARYRVSRRTLYHWRATGRAPLAIKVGRHLRWPQSEIQAWEDRLAAQQSRGAA
jgi:excisionase family DNA binding protein